MRKIALGVILYSCLVTLTYAANKLPNEGAFIKSTLSSSKPVCAYKLYCNSHNTVPFYQKNHFSPIWSKNGKIKPLALKMVKTINNAYLDGLNPRNYHNTELNQLLTQINDAQDAKKRSQILASFDTTLTDAFFLYAYNLHYGILPATKVFKYWSMHPTPLKLLDLLESTIKNANLDSTLKQLAPQYKGYKQLKSIMNEYQQVAINTGDWEPIPDGETMELGDEGDRVYLLQQRLLISGELSEIDKKGEFTEKLHQAVITFQQNNGLYDDGIVDNDTLAILNIPINKRIQLMALNLDKMRWLPTELGSQYIMVNLPDYSLRAVKNNQVEISMDVAVGGSEHPSCVLSSQINSVVLNPYWNLPTSIAGEELWPRLKTTKNFLSQNHYQVLQKDGTGNYVVIPNPEKINWKGITAKNFSNYRFRQDPGKDNSLGKVKFLFPNPCQIYLHDTNATEIFDIYRRDFSHGCIRVSEPRKLSYYILTQQDSWSKRKINGLYKAGKSQTITLSKPINLYLTYFTAWVNDDNWVQFRPDIYQLDKEQNYSVYLPQPAHEASDDSPSENSSQPDTTE